MPFPHAPPSSSSKHNSYNTHKPLPALSRVDDTLPPDLSILLPIHIKYLSHCTKSTIMTWSLATNMCLNISEPTEPEPDSRTAQDELFEEDMHRELQVVSKTVCLRCTLRGSSRPHRFSSQVRPGNWGKRRDLNDRRRSA